MKSTALKEYKDYLNRATRKTGASIAVENSYLQSKLIAKEYGVTDREYAELTHELSKGECL